MCPDCIFERNISGFLRGEGVMVLNLDAVEDYVRQQNKRHPSRQYSWVCCVFICATASTHLISVDFCPFFLAKKLSLQRKALVKRHRRSWSPTKPDLSDGKRRQHLVIASFGISFLPFSLRPFVIIFYNRMSNLPPCRRQRMPLQSSTSQLTHTRFHSVSYKRLSAGLHVTAWPLHNCDPLNRPTVWPPLLSALISPLSFRCQVKPCLGEILAFLQRFSKKKHSSGMCVHSFSSSWAQMWLCRFLRNLHHVTCFFFFFWS